MSIYCVYLTIYKGSKLPPFYIGSTTVDKINKGYRGSVSSLKYKHIWREELAKNPGLFTTKIITTHDTRKCALDREYQFQVATNAPRNELYINEAFAKKNFAYGRKQTTEHIRKRTAHRKGVPFKTNYVMTAEHREKFSFKGRKHSDKAKEAMRQANLGRIDTPETRQRRSDSANGKPKPWLQGRKQSQEILDRQQKSREENYKSWSDEKKQHKSAAISEALKGQKKSYTTNCGKKFICRVEDRKEFSKASAGKYLKDLKQYF